LRRNPKRWPFSNEGFCTINTNDASLCTEVDNTMDSTSYTPMGHGLAGQVALVTGGGRGLGRAFARALAAEGVKVAFTGRTERELAETQTLIEEAGGATCAFPADVTDRGAMERVVAAVTDQFGPVDILVNNAAIITPLAYDWDIDPDEWWRTMEINVYGAYLCTHLVLPSMMARRSGRIVNVSSIAAHTVHPYGTAYCASKAALTHWTNLLAAGVQEYGIYAFALSPSGPTAMVESLATSPHVAAALRASAQATLQGPDHGTPASVQMLLFLLSGRADGLTGRHIPIDVPIDDLVRRTEEIVEGDLYALRLRV
jgi:NAD(P)-dependent dehydrogenase (short-subunit alcohol dehydrogenase family)